MNLLIVHSADEIIQQNGQMHRKRSKVHNVLANNEFKEIILKE